jgi:Fe-S-cluster-containing hydrogenase component 2/CRP-like cAMP-binding protein
MAINDDQILESGDYISAREEALFARDLDGQLIRVDDSTLNDLETSIALTIDGESMIVKKALPLRDSQGTILRNEGGEPIPRPTTIYDAVTQMYASEQGGRNPIPVLCHREHMTPVGVCRVCLVEIEERRKSGRVKKDLVSSCTYHVKDGMVVTTLANQSNEEAVARIRTSIGVVVELLASEHLSREEIDGLRGELSEQEPNELKRLVETFVKPAENARRFFPSERHQQRGQDFSSEIIAVNHDACVMCQRCHRACNDIKENHVIGRAGKGYATTVAFDLGVPMLDSSCVSCGECVISCPTNALTFHPKVIEKQVHKLNEKILAENSSSCEVLTAEEMSKITIFQGIPFKFLQFNAGACIRRRLRPNEVLCERGDYGATAFLIQSGRFRIDLANKASGHKPKAKINDRGRGFWDYFWKGRKPSVQTASVPVSLVTGSDEVTNASSKSPQIIRGKEDVILGEMACLNHYPRTATVVAIEESEVIEIGSNVLYMLQRNASSRRILNDAYRRHALNSDLAKLPVFQGLSEEGRREFTRTLAEHAELMSAEPGQTIFMQGEASDDFYLIRIGYVKVSRRNGTQQQIVNYLGPDGRDGQVGFFGEIAALSSIYAGELQEQLELVGQQAGVRTSTCCALDHVELVRIRAAHLQGIADSNPEFREQLLSRARMLLQKDSGRDTELSTSKTSFVEQGLYNAQSLLVLDLEACTRCDECTKACADSHDGESRLIREGLRFDRFLVATSCRSCTDPYCLVGCPVNAIHREGTKEIVIQDHCIGCGLCASNCPYGNITMYGHESGTREEHGKSIPVIQQKATTCDQCKSIDSDPRCVYACPHHAAFRMTGFELKGLIATKS